MDTVLLCVFMLCVYMYYAMYFRIVSGECHVVSYPS